MDNSFSDGFVRKNASQALELPEKAMTGTAEVIGGYRKLINGLRIPLFCVLSW